MGGPGRGRGERAAGHRAIRQWLCALTPARAQSIDFKKRSSGLRRWEGLPVVSRGSWDPGSHLRWKVLAPPAPQSPKPRCPHSLQLPSGGGAEALRLGLSSWVDEPSDAGAPFSMGLADGHGVATKRSRPLAGLVVPGPQTVCEPGGPGVLSAANPPGPLSAGVCDRPPNFLSPSGDQALGPPLGSVVTLNCTAWVVSAPQCPLLPVQWLKDGQPLGNGSHYDLHEDSW